MLPLKHVSPSIIRWWLTWSWQLFSAWSLGPRKSSTSALPPSPHVHPVALMQHSPGRSDTKNRNNLSILHSRRARAKVTSVQGSRDPIWSRCSISSRFRTLTIALPWGCRAQWAVIWGQLLQGLLLGRWCLVDDYYGTVAILKGVNWWWILYCLRIRNLWNDGLYITGRSQTRWSRNRGRKR